MTEQQRDQWRRALAAKAASDRRRRGRRTRSAYAGAQLALKRAPLGAPARYRRRTP